ncbi:hypothetical protein [Pseudenhygromyxa sp. WMMC2535]|uniref:hypothetical protein n=1 Tax=Pseudenhygromyxa sp. WMMC2535 TaxID=2712867 RepID=UPI001556829A|nr:hypothetical protein [Pseudenhygromyxa sp. WMMC2535]
MTNKVHHLLPVTIFCFLAACGDDGPCILDQNGMCDGIGEDDEVGDETGGGGFEGCAPHEAFEFGTEFTCQGEGTGWLITDIYGLGKNNPLISCLQYEDNDNAPQYPTLDDCIPVSFDQLDLGIPTPTACCTDETEEDNIIDTCELDCGFSACKAAIAKIRESAENLEPSDPLYEEAYDTARADLYAYADMLEAPMNLEYCAELVAATPGEIVAIGLSGGVSNPAKFGHINDATLHLSCTLDPDEPYVSSPSAGYCEEPTNIPATMAEQESSGTIVAGAVNLDGPAIQTTVAIHDASISARETLNSDMSVDFTLTSFEADLDDTVAGSFEFQDAHVSLVGLASGTREAEVVTFAPGTLRFAINAVVLIDGEALYDGIPASAEYGNDATATAILTADGSFHFVDATFNVGEYTAVLNTEPSVLVPAQ